MKIICDNCHTKYSISDSKLTPGKVFKIKCKKCGNVIVVKPAAEEPESDEDATRVVDYKAMSDNSGGPKIWHVVLDKEQEGPFTFEEIKEKISLGLINSETFAWREGLDNWKEIVKIDEFSNEFAASSAAAAPAGSTDTSDKDDNPFASSDEAPGNDDDPFAAFDNNSSKDETPFGASEKRDALFPDDDEPEEEHKPQMKGQRHENSVLFSLDNLQSLAAGGSSKKPMGASRPGYITPSSSGSGLADIQDMSASLSANQPSAPAMMDLPAAPVVATPLASAPILTPIAAPAAGGYGGGASEKPKWLIPAIIGGVLAIVLVIVVFFMMNRSKPSTSATDKSNKVATKSDTNKPMKSDMDVKVASNNMQPDMKSDVMKVDTMKSDVMKVDTMNADVMKVDMKSTMKSTTSKTMKHTYVSMHTTMNTYRPMNNTTKPMNTEPAMTGGCTKVWCMLKNNGPKCCCKYKPGGCGGSSMNASADPCASNSKAKLTRSDIKGGIGRIRGRVNGCFSKYGVHGKVKVRVTVGCNGRVQYAGVRGSKSGTPVGKCIQRAVRRARFPKFKKKSMSFTYPFIG